MNTNFFSSLGRAGALPVYTSLLEGVSLGGIFSQNEESFSFKSPSVSMPVERVHETLKRLALVSLARRSIPVPPLSSQFSKWLTVIKSHPIRSANKVLLIVKKSPLGVIEKERLLRQMENCRDKLRKNFKEYYLRLVERSK